MKKIISELLIIVVAIFCGNYSGFGQHLLYLTKACGDEDTRTTIKVFWPTVENVIALCDMDVTQFKLEMKKNGYSMTGENIVSSGDIGFKSGCMDYKGGPLINALRFDILDGITCFYIADNVFFNEIMADFFDSLRNEYFEYQGQEDYGAQTFMIERKGCRYNVKVGRAGESVIFWAQKVSVFSDK